MVFVGRGGELAVLAAELQRGAEGQPRVVLVEGEAGVGKSSLLSRFIAGCDGVQVLRAGGDEGEMALPYGLLDLLCESGGLPTGEGGAMRPVLAAGAEFVASLGAAQDRSGDPVVVLVDDLHWADLESAGALLFAFRRLRADRVLALVSARPGELARLGEGWSRFIAGHERVTRLRLAGFGSEELVELGRAVGVGELPARAVRSLLDHTEGNPLYCRTLLEELSAEDLVRGADRGLPAPRALSGVIISRVSGLSTPARDLVLAASVLGQHAPLTAVCLLAELEDPAPAIGEAQSAGLLGERDGPAGPELVFAHPLVRRAVYDDLTPARRRDLHAAAARIVSSSAALDHRVAAAAGADAGLAQELEEAAGDAVADGRVTKASWWLAQAASLSPAASERERRLLLAFGRLLAVGDVAGSAALEPEVEALGRSSEASGLLGQLALLRGQAVDAERLLLEAWELHDAEAEAIVGGEAALQLTMYFTVAGRAAEALDWGRRAIAAAEDGSALAFAAATLTSAALAFLGRPEEGIDLLSFLPPDPGAAPVAATDALVYRGITRHWAGQTDGGVTDLRVAAARLQGGAPLRFASQCLALLSEALFRTGAWDDAVVYGELAVSLSTDADRAWDLPFVHGYAAFVPACRGEWDVADGHVAAARAAAAQSGMALPIAISHTAAAALAATRSDHGEVLEATSAIRATGRTDTVGHPGIYDWRALEAEALIELDRLTEAEAAIDELELAIPDGGLRSASVAVARLRGMLAAARRDHAAAAGWFATASEQSAGLAHPFELAVLALADGRRLRQAGERRAAIARLHDARDRFAQLGARPYAERCVSELEQCGAAARSPMRNSYNLTPAELAVARLVAGGKTNRQTAAELYITVKTVEFHLRGVFAKLGIGSRTEIARRLAPAPDD